MSVIIRLQNLPWSANAMDIRTFFRGLSIPEGGVHIVGGEMGDAFIAFSTDEDARQAMMNDGGKIKEVQVKLLLSSRSEMHKVIEAARQCVPMVQLAPQVAPVPQPVLPPPITGMLAQNLKRQATMSPTYGFKATEPFNNQIETIIIDSDDKVKKADRKGPRSRSKSRDRDKRDRGRDKKRSRSRDRSRDRDRRRRDRSRSRDKRDRNNRNRDRKDRSKDNGDNKLPSKKDDKKSTIDNPDIPVLDSNNPLMMNNPLLSGIMNNPMLDSNNPVMMNNPMMSAIMSNALSSNFNIRATEGILGEAPFNGAVRPDQMNSLPMLQNNIRPPFANQRMGPAVWAADSPMSQGLIPMNSISNVRPNLPVQPRATRFSDNLDMDPVHRLQELDERRNPNAFQASDAPAIHGNRNQRAPFPESNNYRQDNGRMGRMDRDTMKNRGMANNNDARNSRYDSRGYCVKIQNLLPSVGYGDIRRFFYGLFISNQGLKIVNTDSGKRSGLAYVKFFKYEGKRKALDKDGESIKGRPVIITSCDDDEFDSAVDSYRPSKDGPESGDEGDAEKNLVIAEHEVDEFKILLIEDLPAFAKEHDIMKMFSDYSLLSIVIVVTKDIRKQYVAYVQFVNADDAKAALNNKSKHLIGHKTIKVSPCSEAAFEIAKANQNMLMEQGAAVETEEPEIENNGDEPSVSDEPGAPDEPVASRDPRQKRYNDVQDDEFRQRFNGMLPNPNAINSHFNQNHRGAMQRRPHYDYNAGMLPPLDCALLKGLPLETTDRDILNFFADVNVIPTHTHLMLTVHGGPSGDCFCEFIDVDEARNAETKHGSPLNGSPISVELVTKQKVDEALRGNRGGGRDFAPRGGRGGNFFPRGGRPPRGGAGYRGGGGGDRYSMTPMGPEGFGVPGCVVALENVPFRAETDEIVDFFRDYDLLHTDVIRRFNENGHCTGDARVRFRSPMDAQQAAQRLNMRCIRDRKIRITVL